MISGAGSKGIKMLKFTDSGRCVFPTDLGPVGFSWTPRGVDRLHFGPADAERVAAQLAELAPNCPPVKRPNGTAADVVKRVKAHLKGRLDSLQDVPVDLSRQSDFSRKVLQKLRRVGPGKTRTYGELAALAGRPGAARAVGRIMGANPVPLIVPCHRCVGSDGSLTGFSTEGGIWLKARLIHLEGYEPNAEYARGIAHLKRRDPKLRRVIPQVGPYRPLPDKPQPPYDTLMTAIIHQQLSVKAGRTIAGRVRALTDGSRFPQPEELLAIDEKMLRGAGLSTQKTSYVRDLAARVADGRLQLNRLRHLDDQAVIAALTEVRGIGEWSAQMHLIFHLDRLDVLPTGDLGLQNAAAKLYGLPEAATAAQLTELGEPWRPYRSMASYYLWRSLDLGGL